MKALDLLAIVIVVTNILDLTHFPMWLLIVYIVLSSLSHDAESIQLKELLKKFGGEDKE